MAIIKETVKEKYQAKKLSESIFTRYPVNKITEDANLKHISKLVTEERGFAAYKYRTLIDKITDYIVINAFADNNCIENKEIKLGKKIPCIKTRFRFNVPNNYTIQIEELSQPQIIVNIDDYRYDAKKYKNVNLSSILRLDKTGSYSSNTAHYANGKLDSVVIEVNLISVNQVLPTNRIQTCLIHEMQHAIEDFNRQKHRKPSLFQYGSINFKTVMALLDKNKTKESEAMSNLIYCLWLSHERSALATSVYSYLQGIDSQRVNFKRDIVNSPIYNSYLRIGKKNIFTLDCCDDWLWWYVCSLLFKARTSENIVKMSSQGKFDIDVLDSNKLAEAQAFKKWFVQGCMKRIQLLMRQIGKIASLYYDDVEN